MKTPLLYGTYLAAANLLLNVVLYLAGAHDSVESIQKVQSPAALLAIALCVGALVLAIREKRALTPADVEWGYGSALGTGVLTMLVGTVIGIFTSYAYYAFLNPGMGDLIMQARLAPMEANGMSAAQIAQAEETMRRFMSPGALAIFGAFSGFIIGTVLALIVAIFLRRKPEAATVPKI